MSLSLLLSLFLSLLVVFQSPGCGHIPGVLLESVVEVRRATWATLAFPKAAPPNPTRVCASRISNTANEIALLLLAAFRVPRLPFGAVRPRGVSKAATFIAPHEWGLRTVMFVEPLYLAAGACQAKVAQPQT